ncbi:unnamed protein product, partial [Mesorhabditis spiculigera]
MRVCAPAGQALPTGMFPGAPCRNPTNPTPSFHLVLNGIEDLILCLGMHLFTCQCRVPSRPIENEMARILLLLQVLEARIYDHNALN